MSDTPRTDKEAFDVTTGKPDIDGVVMADYARELELELNEQVLLNGKGSEREYSLLGKIERLERENAALRRDVYQCPPTSENDYEGFKWNDACEELEQENAALRDALVLIANGAESAKGIAKVALGKEAQPWGNDPIMRRHLSEGGTPA